MVKIRIATLSDIEKLLDCYVEIWESLREWLPDSFINPEVESVRKPEGIQRFKQGMDSVDGIYLIAEQNKEIVGLLTGREHGGVGNIGFLGVRKQYRREGIAAALLNKFFEKARERKAHKVWLYTAPQLLPAIKLYIDNGFVPEGYLQKHTHGLDLIIYSKFL